MNAPQNPSAGQGGELTELRDSARQVLDGLGLAAAEDKSWVTLQDLGWLLVAVPETLGATLLAGAGFLFMLRRRRFS